LERLFKEIREAVRNLPSQDNVINPSQDELRIQAEGFGTRTSLGSFNYVSTVKNLSTALTVYLGSDRIESNSLTQKKRDIKKSAPQTVRLVNNYLKNAPLVRIDAQMGEGGGFNPHCALYLSTYRRDSIRLAYMVAQTLFPTNDEILKELPVSGLNSRNTVDNEPDLHVVLIPEWQEKERQVLVFPEIGVTYILGTDYYGEVKNAFLRMAMWKAKQVGMLGLHAGTQIIHAKGSDNKLRKLGMIMFGISATGKTTHSCHHHFLDQPGEGVEIVQDDVVFWRKDGSAVGSERGLYIKTENLSPQDQPLLYGAAIREDAILENIMVDSQGNVHFDDRTLTANGHAIAQRDGLGACRSDAANLPSIDELDRLIIAFMVRNYTAVPIASKLTPEQAAVAFMLSESIDASGSDQLSSGATSGIGSSPLIIGDASEECNIFLQLLASHGDKIECYMLNTGGAGEVVEHGLDGSRKVKRKVTRVRIPEMAAIIRGIARGAIRWKEDPNWMALTPESVDGMDITRFDLNTHYDQQKIDSLIAAIRLERAEYARQFRGLDTQILNAVEF